jgi:thiol-disulfide isomerase/thioredoxin
LSHAQPPAQETWLVGLAKDAGLALLAVVAVLFIGGRLFATGPATGAALPAFQLPDLAGQPVQAEQLKRGVVVLNFWFTSCAPCRQEIPELSAFAREHPEVPLYGISVDVGMPPERLRALSERLGVGYPVLHDVDGQVSRLFAVDLYPTTVIVHDGVIELVRSGVVDRAWLEKATSHKH